MQVFHHNQTILHFKVSGVGKPLFLLHGFLEDHRMWDTIYPAIVEWGFQVFVFDLPCHGKSRFSGEHCSMFSMADLLNAFCKAYKIENPHVFGHSMGGYVGLELLKLRQISLTLVNSNFWDDSAEKKTDRDRFIKVAHQNKPLLLQEAIPRLFAPQNRAKLAKTIQDLIYQANQIPTTEIAACTRGMRDREDNSALLKTHLIHIIHGNLDEVVDTDTLHQRIKNLGHNQPIYTLENCGHASIWESPTELINYIKLIVFK